MKGTYSASDLNILCDGGGVRVVKLKTKTI